jgi:hypothetical protein
VNQLGRSHARKSPRVDTARFRLAGAASIFFSVLAGPVMARPVIRLGQSIFCETREAGNPHSKFCDYLAWSGWRRRGAWDSSPDNACLRSEYDRQAAMGWSLGPQIPSLRIVCTAAIKPS